MKPFRLLFASAIVAGIVLLGWMLFASEEPLPAGANAITIPTRDGPRTAIVLPAGQGPYLTVIVLHGGSGTAAEVARDTGFAEAAARRRSRRGCGGNGRTAAWADPALPTT